VFLLIIDILCFFCGYDCMLVMKNIYCEAEYAYMMLCSTQNCCRRLGLWALRQGSLEVTAEALKRAVQLDLVLQGKSGG